MPNRTGLKHPMIGTRVLIQAQYREPDATSQGPLLDPDNVQFAILTPDLNVTIYTPPQVARISVGTYELNVIVDQVGQWVVNCSANNTDNSYSVADEVSFVVRQSRVQPG